MFDAGAIQAHLDIDKTLFDKKLTQAKADVKRFTDSDHKVKISAVFDNASLGRARQLFTQLDNQLSREAMQRLRSSPQGSVLGALNALFSPHPVSGGPSPQQAAQQGLLGRIISSPGGGGPAGSGAGSVLLGQAAGRTVSGGGSAHVTIDNLNDVANAINGPSGGDDSSAPVMDPSVGRAATAAERAASASERAASDSRDAATATRDAAGRFAATDNQNRSLLTRLTGLFGGHGGGGGGIAGGLAGASAGKFASGLAGGIGPGVLGLSTKVAGIAGLGGAALGALPALIGGLSPLLAAAPGVGLLALGAKNLIGTKNQTGQPATQGPLYNQAQDASKALKGVLSSADSVLIGPLSALFKSLPALLTPIGPALKQAFSGASTLIQPLVSGLLSMVHDILPQLGGLFRAAAPELAPLLAGLGKLVSGILPGLTTLVRASAPAVAALSSSFAGLGKDLGSMLADFAPVLSQSGVILKALFDLIGALLPAVGSLAAIFARTLAPIFVQFSSVVKSFIPFLTILGKLMASLASAVLGDLVAAFGALAQLLRAIAPALTAFAGAFAHIFTVLENTGIFAVIGDALESLVKPLGLLISALLNGLTPILPPVIKFLSELSAILVAQLAHAIAAILPPITTLATVALAALAQILPIILPILVKFLTIFTGAVADTIVAIADGLNSLLKAIPPKVLGDIAVGFIAIVGAIKLFNAVSGAISAFAAANPVGLIAIAAALLVIGIVELAKHWNTVWSGIKAVAADAWHFIYDGIGKYLLPLLGPVGLIALGAIELAQHWKQVTGAIKSDADSLWSHLVGWGDDIKKLFTSTIPGWWHDFLSLTSSYLVKPLESDADSMWSHLVGWGNDIRNLFTKTIPGIWNEAIRLVESDFFSPFQRGFDNLWSWLYNTFGARLENLFTKTIPGWFNTAVTDIGKFWNKVESTVSGPVKSVVNNVLDRLISAFDWISTKVGGPNIPQFKFATGGIVPGGYSRDDNKLAWVRSGEGILQPGAVAALGGANFIHTANALYGDRPAHYATGGVVGNPYSGAPRAAALNGPDTTAGQKGAAFGPLQGIVNKAADIAKMMAAVTTGNTTALSNAFAGLLGKSTGGAVADMSKLLTAIPATLVKDAVNFLIGLGGSGSGNDIVKYAESFIGKVPYVWGGTSPSGWDCSGFVEYVYNHFGYHPPRTSESQFNWVKKTSTPTPGGLAFFAGSDGTKANPGHVGIIVSANRMVDAYGTGYGTRFDTIAGSSGAISGYGIPPGGFKGGGVAAVGSSVAGWIRQALAATGTSSSWLGGMETLVQHESGGNPNAVNPQTAGLSGQHAEGIAQTIPATFAQFGRGGSIFNPVDDLIASINYIKAVYGSVYSIPGISGGNYIGYANGGQITEPIIGFGQTTGIQYRFGERGNEWVTPEGPAGSRAGGLMRDVYIQLPEGTSVAAALQELNFRLNVAKQQGYLAVRPGG